MREGKKNCYEARREEHEQKGHGTNLGKATKLEASCVRGQGCEASEQRAAQEVTHFTPKRGGVSGRNGYEATPGVSRGRDRRELDKGVGRMRWPRPCEGKAAQGIPVSVLAASHWLDGGGRTPHAHSGTPDSERRATSNSDKRYWS